MRRTRRRRQRALRALDLFSGCGGLTLGLKQAGFRVVGAVEADPLAVATFKKNHRRVRTWQKDIRRLAAAVVLRELSLAPGELDLVAGCPPCQGFSSMRTLNGGRRVRDRQNDLVFDFLRFVRVLRPRAVMMENVPGLAANRRFGSFTRKLKKLGYSCDWRVLDAADYGVPQRRRRLILLGVLGGRPEFAERSARRGTVREAIGHLPRPGKSGDPCHDLTERRTVPIQARIRRIPRNGGSRVALGTRDQLPCHSQVDGFKDVYGRMSWQSVSPTITSGCINPSKGRFLHPTQHRAITLREAALLQTFPATYRFALDRGKYRAATLIGNALPPEFVRRHASALRRSLAQEAVWA